MLAVRGLRTVLGVLAVPAALLAGACSDLRVQMGVFNTVDEARAGGAIAAGWVPDGLPRTASDLRAGHLPDGRQWGALTFPSADAAAVRALLGPELTSGTLQCEPPGRLEFWPRVLRSPVDVERIRATGFHLYTGRDDRTYAINWGQGRAYYWRG
jgi:hypothetical protein